MCYQALRNLEKAFDDCWLLDIKKKICTKVDLPFSSPRYGHTAIAPRDGVVIIFGGYDSPNQSVDGDPRCDLLTFSLGVRRLDQMALEKVPSERFNDELTKELLVRLTTRTACKNAQECEAVRMD